MSDRRKNKQARLEKFLDFKARISDAPWADEHLLSEAKETRLDAVELGLAPVPRADKESDWRANEVKKGLGKIIFVSSKMIGMRQENLMEKIISLCKRRGFVFYLCLKQKLNA
ncbi:MAG: hypothetical protein EXS55_01710 [Candidatus Magasanikbacteria bacterium]|nr:hypothetical protein [Candidatus Magasanikbacteria bacterium]